MKFLMKIFKSYFEDIQIKDFAIRKRLAEINIM